MRLTTKFEPGGDGHDPAGGQPERNTVPTTEPPPSPAARNLALAHHLERLLQRGLVADYTAAARMLGVSQPRMTHLMALLLLAPAIQEAILFGALALGDKQLRQLSRIPEWKAQASTVQANLR